jgi:hypothetical protein
MEFAIVGVCSFRDSAIQIIDTSGRGGTASG